MGLLVAGACSDPDDSQAATLTETKPPPPATELAAETTVAEPSPPAPADPTEPPAAPVEPSVPPAEPVEPSAATDAPAVPEGELDAAAVSALVSAIEAAQSGVTSSRAQVYLTIQLSFEGQSVGAVSHVPLLLTTTVGDRTLVQIDQAALASLDAFEDGAPSGVPADLPPIEIVVDEGEQQFYVKLAPLMAGEAGEQPF